MVIKHRQPETVAMEKSDAVDEVENVAGLPRQNDVRISVTKSKVNVSGTVKLTAGKIVYIPTPTADPRGSNLNPMFSNSNRTNTQQDPLNRSKWQKAGIIIVLSICKLPDSILTFVLYGSDA